MNNKNDSFDWSPQDYLDFGQKNQLLKHQYHKSELFSDSALEELLDNYPRKLLQCYTMGTDPEKHREWTPVHIADRSGAEILEALQKGRFWVNLINIGEYNKAYAEVIDNMYKKIGSHCPQITNIKSSFSALLISSPGVQVYYHLDADANMLWHLKGIKNAWVYPSKDEKFAPQSYIEDIVAQERHENLPYQSSFDEHAFHAELHPGDVVSWPQHSPHRIENVGLNVSLTTSYSSKESRRLIGVHGFNHHFLKKRGVKSRSTETEGLIPAIKEFSFYALNKLGLLKEGERKSTYISDVQVDHRAENGMSNLKTESRTYFSYD